MAAASTAAWARCSFNGGWKRFQMSPCCSTICFYHFTFVFSRLIVWLFESFNWFGCFCVQLIGLLSVVSNFFCLFLLSNVDVSFLQLLFSVVQLLIFFNCFDWFSIVQLFDFSDCCFFHFQFFDPFWQISTVFQSFSCFDCFQQLCCFNSSHFKCFTIFPFIIFSNLLWVFNLWEFNCCLFHQLFQSFQCLHLFDHLNCLHVSFIVSFILFRHFSIVSIHSFNHFICCSFSIVSIPCDRSSTLLSSSWIVDSDMYSRPLVNECGIPQMWGASG